MTTDDGLSAYMDEATNTPRKKRKNSCAKGKSGELQLAKLLTSLGYPARRGQQFKGTKDSPDVVCDSIKAHIECKFLVQGLWFDTALYNAAIEKAIEDAAGGRWLLFWKPVGSRVWLLTFDAMVPRSIVTVSEALFGVALQWIREA